MGLQLHFFSRLGSRFFFSNAPPPFPLLRKRANADFIPRYLPKLEGCCFSRALLTPPRFPACPPLSLFFTEGPHPQNPSPSGFHSLIPARHCPRPNRFPQTHPLEGMKNYLSPQVGSGSPRASSPLLGRSPIFSGHRVFPPCLYR